MSEDKAEMEETKDEVTEEVDETEQNDELETTPISEMNKSQLAEYAKKHNIDTTSATNVKDARKIIQSAIQQAKM